MGAFIAKGKESTLVTKNLRLVPGESVYGEERIRLDRRQRGRYEIDYRRVWNPFRSMLAAGVFKGVLGSIDKNFARTTPPHFPFVGHTAFELKLNFRKRPASARFVPSL